MAHAADFHGDQIRLTAVLRVTGKTPSRPKRLQRNRQEPLPAPIQNGSSNTMHPPITNPVFTAEAGHDGDLNPPEDSSDSCMQSDQHHPSSSSDKHASKVYSASSASSPLDVQEQAMSDTGCRPLDDTVVPSFTKLKKIVYTAQKKRLKRPMGVSDTRKKPQLPENGLVFVRASTEDGLPLPGDAEPEIINSIAHTDPVEDSQLANQPQALRDPQADFDARPSRISKKPKVAHIPTSALGQASGTIAEPLSYKRLFLSRHGARKCHKGSRLSGLSAMCDGFVGHELLIPVAEAKTQAWARKNHTATPNTEDYLSKTIGALQLANGYLPEPVLLSPATSKTNGIPFDDHEQLELVHPSVEQDFDEVRQGSVAPPRRQNEAAIMNQLSGVTAPLRDEESDSSFDEEFGADSDGSGLEDIPESTVSIDSDSMEDFGAMRHDVYSRDKDAFWSQYPGLD